MYWTSPSSCNLAGAFSTQQWYCKEVQKQGGWVILDSWPGGSELLACTLAHHGRVQGPQKIKLRVHTRTHTPEAHLGLEPWSWTPLARSCFPVIVLLGVLRSWLRAMENYSTWRWPSRNGKPH